jgi:hypothetical protein
MGSDRQEFHGCRAYIGTMLDQILYDFNGHVGYKTRTRTNAGANDMKGRFFQSVWRFSHRRMRIGISPGIK